MIAVIFVPQQIWLQSYLDPFVIRIAVLFGPQQNQDCSHIWTPAKPGLQSYMDPSKTKIALIFGPLWNQDCSHIWTLIKLILQSYLDPKMSNTKNGHIKNGQCFADYCIAFIIGPPYTINQPSAQIRPSTWRSSRLEAQVVKMFFLVAIRSESRL